MPTQHPLVLLILDGWGYSDHLKDNAIAAAHTPQWDRWWQTQPHTLLEASGLAVGLPEGQMGNSEVGHMHIGAGRVIPQDFTRINQAISTGEFSSNPAFINAIEGIKSSNHTLHVMGLLSDGGVHSHEQHLFAFLELCAQHQFNHIALHLFLDGRDTSPRSALNSFQRLNQCLKSYPVAQIASISGRYYAMDRDKRWSRVEPVYRLLTEGHSDHNFKSVEEAIRYYYQHQINDEFIPPTRIGQGQSIQSGDALFFFNFRADRARQLTQALLNPDFDGFERSLTPHITSFMTMTSYANNLPTTIAFPPLIPHNTLGEVVAHHGMKQLRLAETEKYAHVTFFLNGGAENEFNDEQRILIQSPLVSTYDLQPEMSAPEITKTLVEAIQSGAYDLIICNYANADMVGHTGNFNAAVQAVESIDRALSEVWSALAAVGGQLLVTADHGNAECMFSEETHQAHTAHTTFPVPLLYVGGPMHFNTPLGSLIDVAPTALRLLGIIPPNEMTGNILLVNNDEHND
jgi:2,3-bisphosphoglycerate-independent phosphoglycerate mutase